jgi:hypothetical protein
MTEAAGHRSSEHAEAPHFAASIGKRQSESSAWRLLVGVGVIVIVGLLITLVVVHASAPASGITASPPASLVGMAEPVSEQAAPAREDVERPQPVVAPNRKGPELNGVVIVPSVGLRSQPTLTAEALRVVVRKNDRVAILERKPSGSGPGWIKIATASGKTGWVWTSVVHEARSKRPG